MADPQFRSLEAKLKASGASDYFELAVAQRRNGGDVSEYGPTLDSYLLSVDGTDFELVKETFPEYGTYVAKDLCRTAAMIIDSFEFEDHQNISNRILAHSIVAFDEYYAMSLIRKIQHTPARESALRYVLGNLARKDLGKAKKIIDGYLDQDFRESVYCHMAICLAPIDIRAAIGLADQIQNPELCSRAYGRFSQEIMIQEGVTHCVFESNRIRESLRLLRQGNRSGIFDLLNDGSPDAIEDYCFLIDRLAEK